MTWTDAQPIKPGFYFYHDSGGQIIGAMVEYFAPINAGDLRVGFTNGWFGSVSSFDGQWAGPLEPPDGESK